MHKCVNFRYDMPLMEKEEVRHPAEFFSNSSITLDILYALRFDEGNFVFVRSINGKVRLIQTGKDAVYQ